MKRTFAMLALLSLVAVACGSGDPDSLTVYSGRSEDLVGPLLTRFTEETGIEVEVRYLGSAEAALLIDQEGDRSPADVVISQSPGATGFLAERGHLQSLSDATLDRVDPAFRNGDGLWVGLSGRIRVLVYNRDLVDVADLPASVVDLTDPSYAGQVAVAPANGSFQDFVTAMREISGDDAASDWLTGMAANDAPAYSGNSAIVEAVGRGEVPMGLVNHYYNFRALAENPSQASVNHYFPSGDIGSFVIVTAAAILDSSDSVDEANQLIEFLLTDESQEYFTTETFEYPLAADVMPWEGLEPLDSLGQTTYDFDSLGGGLERTKELIDASGLEAP